MPINETLSQYSDWSFESAFTIYVLAFVLLIAQYASAKATAAQAKELVGAGAPVTASSVAASSGPGRVIEAPKRPLSERLAGMGFALLAPALVLHIASVVLRGFATHRFPLGNMYEFVTMATAAAALTSVVVLRKKTMRPMLVFVLAPIIVLMFFAATKLYADAAPVVPALRSYWLPIHVTIVSVGSGILLVSGVASLLFLLRINSPSARRAWDSGAASLPSSPTPKPSTDSPTRRPSSPSRCSEPASSSARSGPRPHGDVSGAGTPKKRCPSSRGSSTPLTCTPAPPPAGETPAPRGSTSVDSLPCCSTSSSSTWSSPVCTATQD